MAAKGNVFEEEMKAEVKRRIGLMESPDYEFPEVFGKGDWIGVIILLSVCIIGLAIGIATI